MISQLAMNGRNALRTMSSTGSPGMTNAGCSAERSFAETATKMLRMIMLIPIRRKFIIIFAETTDARETGRAKSCFQDFAVCSRLFNNAVSSVTNSGSMKMAHNAEQLRTYINHASVPGEGLARS